LIVQGSGLCTGIESVGSRAFDIHGSPNNPAYPLRDTQQVFLRDFFMVAANASESTYGLIYFTNVFDSGVENVYISCSPNAAANAIYIAESGGVKLKDVTITGSDLCTGGGNTNTNTGIRVANNSQVSLDNVDVEGFNGTGGSGIATSGAFVNLDIISSHTETDYYAYATADDFGQSSTSYQLDFSIVLYNQFFPTGTITCAANTAPCQILTSAPTSHSTTTATFALAAAGTNGVTLSATPTSTAAFPSICGYLEYYGLDYNNNQSVVPD
jgi:hypothetical protein